MNISLYKSEKEAGFTSEALSKNVVSFLCKVEFNNSKNFVVTDEMSQKFRSLLKLEASTESLDLYPLKSLLVSTCWNINQDVFTAEEIWPARYTAKDKPITFEHDENDILGHMTGSWAVKDDGSVLSDDLTLDELPNKYHVLSNAVLYKYWGRSEDKQKRMATIIEEIPDNKWYVSVEALFGSFDYVLLDEAGQSKTIARNEKTAFLTKHLIAYGGRGIYDKYKVGRLPRNIILSGKALTRKPANVESIIFAKKYDLIEDKNSVVYDISLNNTQIEVNNTMDEKQVAILNETIKNLQTKNDQLVASLKENDAKQYVQKIEALEVQVKTGNEKILSTENLLKAAKEELESGKAQFVELQKKHKADAEELAKIQLGKKISDRMVLVSTKLKLDETKAKKFVDCLATLGDELFAAHVEAQAEILSAAIVTPKVEEKKEEKKEVVTASKVLETVVPEKKDEAALGTNDTGVNKVEAVRASICNFLSQDDGSEETEEK